MEKEEPRVRFADDPEEPPAAAEAEETEAERLLRAEAEEREETERRRREEVARRLDAAARVIQISVRMVLLPRRHKAAFVKRLRENWDLERYFFLYLGLQRQAERPRCPRREGCDPEPDSAHGVAEGRALETGFSFVGMHYAEPEPPLDGALRRLTLGTFFSLLRDAALFGPNVSLGLAHELFVGRGAEPAQSMSFTHLERALHAVAQRVFPAVHPQHALFQLEETRLFPAAEDVAGRRRGINSDDSGTHHLCDSRRALALVEAERALRPVFSELLEPLDKARLGYSAFLHFCTEFKLYPGVITNASSVHPDSSFELYHCFLHADQGLLSDFKGPRSHRSSTLHLKPARLQELHSAFAQWDVDGSGAVAKSEMAGLLEQAFGHALPDSVVDSVFDRVDADGSGDITFDEFCAAFAEDDVLKAHVAHIRLSLPEFVLAVMLVSCVAFSEQRYQRTQEHLAAEAAARSGNAIEQLVQSQLASYAAAPPLVDRELGAVRQRLQTALRETYALYCPDGERDKMDLPLFKLLVRDSRLFAHVPEADVFDVFGTVSSEGGTVGPEALFPAFEQLLRREWCQKKQPSLFCASLAPDNPVTPYGLALRNAVLKLRLGLKVYRPQHLRGATRQPSIRRPVRHEPSTLRPNTAKVNYRADVISLIPWLDRPRTTGGHVRRRPRASRNGVVSFELDAFPDFAERRAVAKPEAAAGYYAAAIESLPHNAALQKSFERFTVASRPRGATARARKKPPRVPSPAPAPSPPPHPHPVVPGPPPPKLSPGPPKRPPKVASPSPSPLVASRALKVETPAAEAEKEAREEDEEEVEDSVFLTQAAA